MRLSRPFVLLLALAVAACAGSPPRAQPATRFVLVRHAEKAAGDDPPLTAAGEQRAARLAALLRATPPDAIYATGYRRTRQTAQALADAFARPVLAYDAREDAAAFAARLRAAHAGTTVVVVGHSNTVPALAAALCGCPVTPIDESDYGRQLRITLAADGAARLEDARY